MTDHAALIARLNAIKQQWGHFNIGEWPSPEVGEVIDEAIAALAQPPAPAERERIARVSKAMWAMVDHLKATGHPFDSWPDSLKDALADAIISHEPPTEADMKWARERRAALDAAAQGGEQ